MMIWTAVNCEVTGRGDEPFVMLDRAWTDLQCAKKDVEEWCDGFSAWPAEEREWRQLNNYEWTFENDDGQATLTLKYVGVREDVR